MASDGCHKLILQGFSGNIVQILQWFTQTEQHLYALLQDVCGATGTHGTTIEHMRIDRRHIQILVAHQFLNRADVLALSTDMQKDLTPLCQES